MTEHRVIWEVTWWTDAGRPRSDQGEDVVSAGSPGEAMRAVEARIRSQIDGDRRPVRWRARLAGQPRSGTTLRYPGAADMPDATELRARYARSPGLAALLAEMPDGIRPIDRMVALHGAFYLELETLSPVADWAAGDLGDAELDDRVGATIEELRPQWELSLRFRAAFAGEQSVAALMRRAYERDHIRAIRLVVELREAFDLSLMVAKELVDTVCSGRDEEADARLAAEIRARRQPD